MIAISPFSTNKLFDVNFHPNKNIIVHEGGTSSSKTYSVLQSLSIHAVKEPGSVITVAGQDIPNLKKGPYRQMGDIVRGSEFLLSYFRKENMSDRIFEFKNKSIIEFNSYDDYQDAKSGKRNYLFANEANGIPYDVFEELNVRTDRKTYVDFNPTARFWAHDRLKGRENVLWVKSNFTHNSKISPDILKKILGYEPTPDNIARGTADEYRWRVYGLGELGRLEGLVLPNFEVTYSWPLQTEGRRYYGLDFGFANDPSTLVEVVEYNGDRYYRTWFYETGMSNSDIFTRLISLGWDRSWAIVADSAEPKSILELNKLGLTVLPAEKGPDSVRAGVGTLNDRKQKIWKGSKEMIEEAGSYTYIKGKNGEWTNQIRDKNNHTWDASRYALSKKTETLSTSSAQSMADINLFTERRMI